MRRSYDIALTIVAWFQVISTVIGWFTLAFMPSLYDEALDPTPFAGQQVLASILLGAVVGGTQWAALIVGRKAKRWLALGHLIAGSVMVGWIFGECLVLNSFVWVHALWGGMGVVQLLLVAGYLGVLRPHNPTQ